MYRKEDDKQKKLLLMIVVKKFMKKKELKFFQKFLSFQSKEFDKDKKVKFDEKLKSHAQDRKIFNDFLQAMADISLNPKSAQYFNLSNYNL